MGKDREQYSIDPTQESSMKILIQDAYKLTDQQRGALFAQLMQNIKETVKKVTSR